MVGDRISSSKRGIFHKVSATRSINVTLFAQLETIGAKNLPWSSTDFALRDIWKTDLPRK
jgi:hypothetical protein